jgi:glutamate formiminotransferase / formiminotetrahydrofolate cyclodeaminase
MNRIVECVPNFSEGRRPEVVDAIVQAITSVGDIYLLGREMDADHNRAVITIAGFPESIGEAAFRGVEAAARHIDLTRHSGEHPRIGAADVVPFVPIRGVSLAECVEIAKETGRKIADNLKIPVYLYEAAAARPDRVNLENIRRGQFEELREEISTKPERKPDIGEAKIHPTAGATVVGARKPLIAYNINLNTPDVGIAQYIAKRIRFSSGGFRYVKAMGVLLKDRNQAQVSMNLTDFEKTPMELVFETVRREAERYGVTVGSSEIVGLVPQKALEKTAEFYLRVENFKPEMILENRLDALISGTGLPFEGAKGKTRLARLPFDSLVERVASADAVPGGGSVAAAAGAMGAGLGQMAIRITKEKKNYAQYADRFVDALDRLAPYASTLLELVDADSEAYTQVMAAYSLPKGSPEREKAVQEGLIRATEIPSRTGNCAAEALRVLEQVRSIVHINVASDLQVGMLMLRTCLRGAIVNMRTNLGSVKDSDVRMRYEDMITGWEQVLRGN